jgi:hypothetical protein
MMDQYRGVDLGDIAPHVYAIADAAYRQMRKEMRGQSILVRSRGTMLAHGVQTAQHMQTWEWACMRLAHPPQGC